jgi:hypothetical protein
VVAHNPWTTRVPVESLKYSFNLTEFPQLPMEDNKTSPMDTTHTTLAETTTLASGQGAATAVSAITEDFVFTTIKNHMADFNTTRTQTNDAFARRLQTLETTLADISSTVESISSKMANDLIQQLDAPNGILTQQKTFI